MRGTSTPCCWFRLVLSISRKHVKEFPESKKNVWWSSMSHGPWKDHSLQIHILQTALEGRFEESRDKEPQSGVVEEIMVPEVCILQGLHGN